MTRRFTSFGSHNSHNESQEGLLHATMSPSHQRLPLSLNGSSSSELKDGKGRRSGAFGAKRAVLIVAAFALALWTGKYGNCSLTSWDTPRSQLTKTRPRRTQL